MSKKNFGSLSRGQKGQNPPHSSDLEKKSKFKKKIFFELFFFYFDFDDFDVDKFQFSLYTLSFLSSSLVYLIVMDLENVRTKIFEF